MARDRRRRPGDRLERAIGAALFDHLLFRNDTGAVRVAYVRGRRPLSTSITAQSWSCSGRTCMR